jgi:hypothetical protein
MRSLRSQLSLAMLSMILVTIAFISVFANMAVNRQFEEYIARQEQTRCENIAGDLSRLYGGAARGWDPDSLHAIGMYSLYDGYVLTVSDAAGKKIWDAENHDMSLCREIMGDISERMSRREKTGGFTTRTYPLTQGERKVGSVSIKAYGPYFFQENDFRFIRALNALLLTLFYEVVMLIYVALDGVQITFLHLLRMMQTLLYTGLWCVLMFPVRGFLGMYRGRRRQNEAIIGDTVTISEKDLKQISMAPDMPDAGAVAEVAEPTKLDTKMPQSDEDEQAHGEESSPDAEPVPDTADSGGEEKEQ